MECFPDSGARRAMGDAFQVKFGRGADRSGFNLWPTLPDTPF
jgi:hypothetical protein